MNALKEPNNLRNRYRRYRLAMRAYGWGAWCLRGWYHGALDIKTAYSGPANFLRDPVPENFKLSTKAPHCICRRCLSQKE